MTQKLNYNYDNFRILDMSTEACYQKIDPRVAGSLICLHQPETDGNVEIVGREGGREGGLIHWNLALTPTTQGASIYVRHNV